MSASDARDMIDATAGEGDPAALHSKEMAESMAGSAGVGAASGAAFGAAVGTAGGGPAAGLLGAAVGGLAGAVAGSAIGSERGPGGGSMDMQHAYGMDPDRLTHHMPDMGRDPMMKPPQSGSTQE